MRFFGPTQSRARAAGICIGLIFNAFESFKPFKTSEETMKEVTIVVGTIGQSIMRSEDNGQTWARIGPRRGFAYEASVRCIAMHPKEHKRLFAGTERGLYRSEDGGANWKYIDSVLNPHY